MLIIKEGLQKEKRYGAGHTVDSDGNDLRQSVAVGTLESGDLADGAELGVLSRLVERGSGVSLSLDQLDLNVVGLGRDEGGDSATVLLRTRLASYSQPRGDELVTKLINPLNGMKISPRRAQQTYRKTVDLAERHCERCVKRG